MISSKKASDRTGRSLLCFIVYHDRNNSSVSLQNKILRYLRHRIGQSRSSVSGHGIRDSVRMFL